MPASIRSTIVGKTPPSVDNASREDLRAGDVVMLEALDLTPTTFSWDLTGPIAEDGTPSSAVLSSTSGAGPITFTVDNEGSYLVRLTTDQGTVNESIQHVRLRFQTIFGNLRLVAPGERRDDQGVIPVDISAIGWATDQNFNLQRLLSLIKPLSTSGRVFTVDANRGVDNANTPNDPTIAEGFGAFSSINLAIQAAQALTPPPSETDPVVIKIQPGLYEEDLAMVGNVHLIGLGAPVAFQNSATVLIRTTNVGLEHVANIAGNSDTTFLCGLTLENTVSSSNATLRKIGNGTLYLDRCVVLQSGLSATQGPAVHHTDGLIRTSECVITNSNQNDDLKLAWLQDTAGNSSFLIRTEVTGRSGMDIDPANVGGISCTLQECLVSGNSFASATAFGIRSNADLLDVRRTAVFGPFATTRAILIHPDQGVRTDPLGLKLDRASLIGGNVFTLLPTANVEFDVTNATGDNTVEQAASDYGAINVIGGSLTSDTSFTRGQSIAFDDTTASLGVTNVQAALDALASAIPTPGGPSILDNVVTITNVDSPYAVADDDHLILVDTTGGAVTVDLPTSVTGALANRDLIIKDAGFNAGTNNITISGGAGTVDQAASVVLNLNEASLRLVCNGLTGASTVWYVI